MNLAKISANGQITVPIEIRRLLDLSPGDKILLYQNPRGEVVMEKAAAEPSSIRKPAAPEQRMSANVLSEEDDTRALLHALQSEKD